MVINDLKDQIPLREISRISGISLSGYYYRPSERHVERLDPSTRARIGTLHQKDRHTDTGECGQYSGIKVQR